MSNVLEHRFYVHDYNTNEIVDFTKTHAGRSIHDVDHIRIIVIDFINLLKSFGFSDSEINEYIHVSATYERLEEGDKEQ